MSLILDIPMSDLEKVIYYSGYVVTEVDKDEKKKILEDIDKEYKAKVAEIDDEELIDQLKSIFQTTKNDIVNLVPGVVLDEIKYTKFSEKFPNLLQVEIGAEAVYGMMKKVNLKRLLTKLEKEMETVPSTKKAKLTKRIHLVKEMIQSGVRPE